MTVRTIPQLLTSLLAALWLACLPLPAHAQDITVAEAAWENPDDALPHPRLVNIGIPREAGDQHLVELADFNNNGGRDNMAQYRSADGRIFATIYIYRTTLGEPAWAPFATDFLIRNSYGDTTERSVAQRVPAGGAEEGALLFFYDNAFGGARATAAAFASVGPWIVKLRVTGPQERRVQIVSDALALLDNLTLGEGLSISPAANLGLDDCSSAPSEQRAVRIENNAEENIDASTLAAAAIAVAMIARDEVVAQLPPDTPLPEAARPATAGSCIIATRQFSEQGYLIAVGEIDTPGQPHLVLIGDAGRAFQLVPPFSATDDDLRGYNLIFHQVGPARLFGSFDRAPTADQYFELLAGEGEDWMGASPLSVTISEDGEAQIVVNLDVTE